MRIKVNLITVLLILGMPIVAESAPPAISPILDTTASKGSVFSYTPGIANASEVDRVNWTKAYGPDAVQIHPLTGSISWVIPSDIPSESFHVGVKATTGDGFDIESFIIHVAIDKIVYIGPSEQYKSTKQAFESETTPGTTFVLRNGTYSGMDNKIGRSTAGASQMPPAGEPDKYTSIIAEDPGEVTFTNGAAINIEGIFGAIGYLTFKGIFFDGGHVSTTGWKDEDCQVAGGCKPHHIKFIRNGVKANEEGPFTAGRSHHILFENNYAFGGGRYKYSSYQSDNILWRRNISRRDRATASGEPKGNYSVYTTMDSYVANNLAIDGDQEQFSVSGSETGEYGCPTTSGPSRVIFEGNIQLNSQFLLGNADNQSGVCDARYYNMVSWDVRPTGAYMMSRAASYFDHATLGNVKPRESIPAFFNAWPGDYARGVTNSVLHDFKGLSEEPMFWGMKSESNVTVIDAPLDRHGVTTSNISGFTGNLVACCTQVLSETISAVNPMYSETNRSGGIRYLVRIERNSNLSDINGGIGATVTTFRGQSGTLYGETGYDEETDIPMWPFPFEDKIKEKLASYSYTGPTYVGQPENRTQSGTGTINGARGFAVEGESLTSYVWGYLGSTVPPFDVTGTAGDKSALIKWNPHPSDHRSNINKFNIYIYDPATGNMSSSGSVTNSTFEFLVDKLEQQREYHFVVTAVDSIKGESSYSYPVSVIPTSKPNPLPPELSGI